MALLADRVKETTTTTGTGTIALAGAPAGFQSFNTAFSNGSLVYYVIQSNADFEIGIGTTGAGTLARTTVLQSSNADALVPFAAGVKDVFCSYVADRAVTTSDASTLTNKTIDDYTNNVGANSTHFRVKANGTIGKGAVIKATGFVPGEQAIEVGFVTSATDTAIGIMEQALTVGQFGMAVVIGELFDVNTNAFAFNDVLYSNGAGGLTATKPSTGTYQTLGTVVRSNTNNGVIAVNIVSPHVVEASTNTANTLALRDGSGNFAAGTITAALAGNASTATALQTARAINGVNFDGTAAITVTAAAGTLTGATLASNVLASSLTSVGTLAALTVTAPITGSVTGSSGSTTGNAATATALQTGRAINGVTFDGTAPITVTAAAGTLSGATLASGVTASSLTSVGTLTGLTVTNPITGSVTGSSGSTTGNAATATALQTARAINGTNFDGTAAITVTAAAGTVTGATLASNVLASSLTSVGTLAGLTVTAPITGSVTGSSGSTTGNAATATALQTSRNINGTAFNGTADITVTAAAGTLTGATLASGVTASSLTSVGTLTSLAVSGNLTVDTDTLVVDSANNRVGVGIASPAYPLQVRRAGGAGSLGVSIDTVGATDRTVQYFAVQDNAAGAGSGHAWYYRPSGTTTDTLGFMLDELGNLAVDTNTLFVDAANNRVGVGTASPSVPLEVTGNALLSGASGYKNLYFNSSIESNSRRFAKIGKNYENTGVDAYDLGIWASTNIVGQTAATVFYRDITTESMRIDGSGNLAVDTNTLYVDATNNRVGVKTAAPANTLEVQGGLTLAGTTTITSGRLSIIRGDNANFGISGAIGIGTQFADTNGYLAFGRTPSGATGEGTFTEQARINLAGNFGLGVVPSAWSSANRVLEISSTGNVAFQGTLGRIVANAYFDQTDNRFEYIGTGEATAYTQESGAHKFFTAPSGTANAAITFTQAMTLDASGQLSLGTVTASGTLGRNITLNGAASGTNTGLVLQSGSVERGVIYGNDTQVAFGSTTAIPTVFTTTNIERARIDTSGNLGIGTASPATRLDVNGATTMRGHQTFVADATYDIGASGATRPRSLYLSSSAVISTGASRLTVGSADAVVGGIYGNATGEIVMAVDALRVFNKGVTIERMQVDNTTTAGQTALRLYDVDNGTLERVTVGAADSGGVGFKVLRIPN